MTASIIIRNLGKQDYQKVWQQMQSFVAARTAETLDEFWLLQHPPVFTQGQAGKVEHVLNPGNIPVIQTDRGGQVTYHGPGQLVVYVLLDLQRLQIGTRQLVTNLENAVIRLLADYKIIANTRCDAPGVYVDQAKICSIGLRIRKGFSYHGLALNIDMDLEPFSRINPCGYQGLKITQLRDHVESIHWVAIEDKMIQYLTEIFTAKKTDAAQIS